MIKNKHKEKLLSYLNYKENWDGEGAMPAKKEIIDAAIQTLDLLPDKFLKEMRCGFAGDGEVFFIVNEGHNPNNLPYLEMGWDVDGDLVAFGYVKNKLNKKNENDISEKEIGEITVEAKIKDGFPNILDEFIKKNWGTEKQMERLNDV